MFDERKNIEKNVAENIFGFIDSIAIINTVINDVADTYNIIDTLVGLFFMSKKFLFDL